MTSTPTQRRANRRYLTSLTADTGATEVFDVALAWTAATSSGSGAGIVLAAAVVPRVALFPIGGAVSDRFGLGKVAQVTLIVRVLLMVAYVGLLLSGETSVLWLSLVAVLFATADAFHDPAMRAMTKHLTDGDEGRLVRLNSSATVWRRTVTITATLAAGSLVTHGAAPGAIALVMVAVALVAMRATAAVRPDLTSAVPDETNEGRTVVNMARDGLTYVASHRIIRAALAVMALSNLIVTPAVLLGIPLRSTAFDWPGWAYGATYAAFAVGGLCGAACAPWVQRRVGVSARVGALMLAPQAGALIGLALAESPVIAAAFVFLAGVFGTASAVVLDTVTQHAAPRAYQARIGSLSMFAIGALIPVGHLAFAAAAGASLVGAGVSAGALLLAVAVLGSLF